MRSDDGLRSLDFILNYQRIFSWGVTWFILGSRTGCKAGNELERVRVEAQRPFRGCLQ